MQGAGQWRGWVLIAFATLRRTNRQITRWSQGLRKFSFPLFIDSFPIVTTGPSPTIAWTKHPSVGSHPSAIYFAKPLNILQLVLIQPEIVTQFMDDRKADLFADFGLAGADRFDIFLIEHDVIGS